MINWIKTSDRLPVIPEGETESAALLLYYPDPEIGYYRNTGEWFKEDPYWQELDSPDYWAEINPPGERFADFLTRTNVDPVVSDGDKAIAILKAFHDIAHNSEKTEGLIITRDWDINTLTIETKEGHHHFGQMDSEDEKGFSILLDALYRHYVIGK